MLAAISGSDRGDGGSHLQFAAEGGHRDVERANRRGAAHRPDGGDSEAPRCGIPKMMNLLSPEVRRNPYPAYDQIRSVFPLLRDSHSGLWMIFDYEGAWRAVNDHDAFSSSLSTAGRRHPKWMFFTDPPLHTKLRALVMRA